MASNSSVASGSGGLSSGPQPLLNRRTAAKASGPGRNAFGTLVFQAHRWTGLTFGLALLFEAITAMNLGCLQVGVRLHTKNRSLSISADYASMTKPLMIKARV